MLRRYLEAWGSENYDPPHRVLDHDDDSMLANMRADVTNDKNSERGKWAFRLLNRDHPRCLYESSDHADALDLESSTTLLTSLQREFPDAELILDPDARGNVHKLFVRGETEKIDDLFIESKVGAHQRVTDQSKILQNIPKGFWVIRIYGYFKNEDEFGRACQHVEEVKSRFS
jgi:hypothetical protein